MDPHKLTFWFGSTQVNFLVWIHASVFWIHTSYYISSSREFSSARAEITDSTRVLSMISYPATHRSSARSWHASWRAAAGSGQKKCASGSAAIAQRADSARWWNASLAPLAPFLRFWIHTSSLFFVLDPYSYTFGFGSTQAQFWFWIHTRQVWIHTS